MNCVILAAGYATRLYPLTNNLPKALLRVNGKRILDYIFDDLKTIDEIDRYILVSNHKFYDEFVNWKNEYDYNNLLNIEIIDDGTIDNEHRLGALNDLNLVALNCNVNDDVLVLASDNLTDFSIKKLVENFKQKDKSCVFKYYEPDVLKLKKSSILSVDENDKINLMQEKPGEIFSNWCCPPFYLYKKDDFLKISDAINEDCNADAPRIFCIMA